MGGTRSKKFVGGTCYMLEAETDCKYVSTEENDNILEQLDF